MSKFARSAAGAGLRAELKQWRCDVHAALIEPGAIHTGFNQAMTDRKYTWMEAASYFAGQVERMKREEARKPKVRCVAPWIQGLGVRVARIFGV